MMRDYDDAMRDARASTEKETDMPVIDPDKKHHWVEIMVTNLATDDEGHPVVPEERDIRNAHSHCSICFVALDDESLETPCPGARVPDTIESLMGTS